MKKIPVAALTLLLILGFLASCTSTEPKSELKEVVLTSPVIQHPGLQNNIMSEVSRSQWLQVRKGQNAAQAKLYASLGARAFDVAIQDARNYLAKNPKDFNGLVVLATGLAMTGQYQLAGYYGNLIDTYYPGQALTRNLRGLAQIHRPDSRLQNYQQAAAFFHEGMTLDPEEVASALNLGQLYLKMGNAPAALEVFQDAKERCKACVVAQMGEGTALVRMQKYRAAKEIFDNILAHDPKAFEAHYRLALIFLYGAKNPGRARTHLSQILDAEEVDANLDLKRRANVLIRRIDAAERPSFVTDTQAE